MLVRRSKNADENKDHLIECHKHNIINIIDIIKIIGIINSPPHHLYQHLQQILGFLSLPKKKNNAAPVDKDSNSNVKASYSINLYGVY